MLDAQPSQAKGIHSPWQEGAGAADTPPRPSLGHPLLSGGFWLPVCLLASGGTNWQVLDGRGHSWA